MENELSELKALLQRPEGKVLHQFILGHYQRIKNIEYLTDYETTASIALEVKATKKAIRILQDLLCDIIDLEQQPNVEQVKPEDSYV